MWKSLKQAIPKADQENQIRIVIIIGNPQQRNKIQSASIVFCGNVISPSESARNLGVTFDSNLSLTKHISSICKSAYYQIRQLHQIRSSLDISSAIILVNSLVISKLDYCNSLLNGLPKSSINRLQVVQNSLARTLYPSAKRSDHILPVLHKLHWLPVSSRIEFKIATLTFKVLKFQQPAYIYDLIAPYIPPRSLWSSNKNLLIVPDIRSEMDRRSFSFASPSIWNSLPQHIRSSDSITGLPWSTQDLLISKVSSTIVINSLHNVSSDFDLRTHNGFLSSMHIPHRFIPAE